MEFKDSDLARNFNSMSEDELRGRLKTSERYLAELHKLKGEVIVENEINERSIARFNDRISGGEKYLTLILDGFLAIKERIKGVIFSLDTAIAESEKSIAEDRQALEKVRTDLLKNFQGPVQ